MTRVSEDSHRGPTPNVLWILCDELRADALSCYGNARPELHTPHIDRLARDGVTFERAYCTSPVCVPARTSLLTGALAQDSGVYGNEAAAADYPPASLGPTFPELFAAAGWRTGTFGKSHVPSTVTPWQEEDATGFGMGPIEAGAVDQGKIITQGTHHMVAGVWPEDTPFPPAGVTERVLSTLEVDDEPFLIRASYLQPHTPVLVPEPWAGRYADVPFEQDRGRWDGGSHFERRLGEVVGGEELTDEQFRSACARYHGLVAWLDEQVGHLLDALDRHGLADRTLVVFTADHGAYLGENGAYGKHTFAPQSHRIPLLVRWPGHVEPGWRRADLVHGVDLPRTLLGAAGLTPDTRMGGRNLFSDPAPEHIVSAIGYGAARTRAFPNLGVGTGPAGGGWPQRFCVRTQRYRFDLNTRLDGHPTAPQERDEFLADLHNDPDETTNVSDEPAYAGACAELRRVALETLARAVQPPDDAVYRTFVPPSAL